MSNTVPAARMTVDDIVVRKSARNIVEHLSFQVRAGEVLGLIGPNGAGKSTLLSCMAGIDSTTSGAISIDGTPLTALSLSERARIISWVEQLGAIHWPLSVERLVMLGRIPHLPRWSKPGQSDTSAVQAAMQQADCEHLRDRRVTTLSGGERSRVLLARALAAEPSILLADEPVTALDLKHQLQTMHVLRRFVSNDNAAVVVMHDLSLAARFCDRLLLICEGRLIAIGEVAAVLSEENIAQVYGVSVKTGCDQVPWVIPSEVL